MRFMTACAGGGDVRRVLQQLLKQFAAEGVRRDTVSRPNLGLLYFTPALAPHAQALLDGLRAGTGVAQWAGCSAPCVWGGSGGDMTTSGAAAMLLRVHRRDVRVFSGLQPLRLAGAGWRGAATVMAHGDGGEPDCEALLDELAGRTRGRNLRGGLLARGALQVADGVFQGGVSGVALSARVAVSGGVASGRAALGPARVVTQCDGALVQALDGRPACDALFEDLGMNPRDLPRLLPLLRGCHARMDVRPAVVEQRSGGPTVAWRRVAGLQRAGGGIAFDAPAREGASVRFYRRDAMTLRRDLVRLCTAVRDELEQRRETRLAALQCGVAELTVPLPTAARGAVLVVDAVCAELDPWALVRRYLGAVPIVGWVAPRQVMGAAAHEGGAVLTVFGEDPIAEQPQGRSSSRL